ncbi:peroxidase family protein [Microbacterium sp. NPDC078428]|uniref:peroxidase family protein n=1 Tax=Microbacterium sp. NPDC078428 TaxID=3364190 RepID=UPI0037C8E3F1
MPNRSTCRTSRRRVRPNNWSRGRPRRMRSATDEGPRAGTDTRCGGSRICRFRACMRASSVECSDCRRSFRRTNGNTFEAAQRIVRWHYQWIVVHDFLRRIVGAQMRGKVFKEEPNALPVIDRRFFKWKYEPYMPVESSVAAYRFGHSMIRGRYRLNTLVGGPGPSGNGGPLPTFTPDSANPLGHFGGFRILPPFWTIEWARFFEVDGASQDGLQPSRLIDTKLANPLAALPPEIAGNRPSLISRNLTRGARMMLPSGQDVAAHMGGPVLSDADLELPGGGAAPLWYYILKEASLLGDGGKHLGPIGGRIVAEVMLGLMSQDPSSYLRVQPTWKPFLPAAEAEDFTVPDLIKVAGHGLGVTDLPAPPSR